MERRNFIKGILAGVAGSEALVRLATPAEAAVLTKDAEVVMGHPMTLPTHTDIARPVFMQDARGHFREVGFVTSVKVTADAGLEWRGEAILTPSTYRAYGKSGTLVFEGPGDVLLTQGPHSRFRLSR